MAFMDVEASEREIYVRKALKETLFACESLRDSDIPHFFLIISRDAFAFRSPV